MRCTANLACSNRPCKKPSAPPSSGVTERQRIKSRAMAMVSAVMVMSNRAARISSILVRTRHACTKAKLDQQEQRKNRKRHGDQHRNRVGRIIGAGHFKNGEQI